MKVTLAFLAKVVRGQDPLGADDVRPVLAAGVSPQGVRDALAVAWLFDVITRLADTFDFDIPDERGHDWSAARLLSRGYQ